MTLLTSQYDSASLVGLKECDVPGFSVPHIMQHVVPAKWSGLWSRYAKELEEFGRPAPIGYVYWKLGRDVGRSMGDIHRAGISWGNFP